MKHSILLTTIALLLLTLSLSAVAQKPTITQTPLTPFTITGRCTFDILGTPQVGRPNGGRTISFANTIIIAGPVFVTLENLTTHKTINANISGPAVINFSGGIPTQVMFLGQILSSSPESEAAGLPPVGLDNGRLVLTFDAQGNIASVKFTGTAQNVCQLLE